MVYRQCHCCQSLTRVCLCRCCQTILRELPELGLQTPPSRREVLACGNPRCLAPLTPATAQLALLSGKCSRASLAGGPGTDAGSDTGAATSAQLAEAGALWCTGGCGECFCSSTCAERAAPSHRLLCTGPISDDEPDHPLLRFKLHALRCNEAFLLAAEVVVILLSEAGASGATATQRAAEKWIRHFQPDGPLSWWDVAQQPEAMIDAGVTQLTFRDSCRANVTASSLLLEKALHNRAPTLAASAAPLLEVDGFYGQLLGLFELYSMGVRVPSAIGSLCEKVRATGTDSEKRSLAGQLDAYVAAAETAMDSDDAWCDEGEGESEEGSEQQGGEAVRDEVEQDQTDGRCAKRQKTASSSPDPIEAASPDTSCQCSSEVDLEQCEHFIAAAAAGEVVEFPPLDATVRACVTASVRERNKCGLNAAGNFRCCPGPVHNHLQAKPLVQPELQGYLRNRHRGGGRSKSEYMRRALGHRSISCPISCPQRYRMKAAVSYNSCCVRHCDRLDPKTNSQFRMSTLKLRNQNAQPRCGTTTSAASVTSAWLTGSMLSCPATHIATVRCSRSRNRDRWI